MEGAACRDCCELTDARSEACAHCGSKRLVVHSEISNLDIAHIDCDAFYASVEKRDRPDIAGEPVIVGHPGGRGVVTTACYIARTFGVRSAMPMFKARDLCPHAIVIAPDMAKYKRVSEQIRAIFLSATPTIEPVSLDEAYLDLGISQQTTGRVPALSLASIACRIEREIGITVSIGLSHNKSLAKLASELEKPRGFSVIGRAETKGFLQPLSVRKVHGVGGATAERLEARGIATIGQLQTLSEMQLVAQFGRLGRRLAQFAQGRDDRKVVPHRPAKSVSAETTFAVDTSSPAELQAAANPLCERVAAHLVRKRLAGGTVVLKLKTSDFRLLTRSRRLANPTQRAQTLVSAVCTLIEKEADGRSFRLIGVGVDEICPASTADPPDLFENA